MSYMKKYGVYGAQERHQLNNKISPETPFIMGIFRDITGFSQECPYKSP